MTNSNQIIEEGLKTFDKKFEEHPEDEIIYATLLEVKSFFRTFAEKIYKKAREEVIKEVEKELEHWKDNYQNWKTRMGSSDLTEATLKVEALADILKALKE